MKLSMSEVLHINGLHENLKNQKLSAPVAYKFAKLFRRTNQEADFYSMELSKCILAHCEYDEDGRPKVGETPDQIQLKKEEIPVFEQEVSDLWKLEVEIEGCEFTMEELQNVSLTVEEFDMLLPLIKE